MARQKSTAGPQELHIPGAGSKAASRTAFQPQSGPPQPPESLTFSSFGAEGCEQWGHCQDHEPAPGHCHSPVAGAGHTKPQFQAAALKLRSYL